MGIDLGSDSIKVGLAVPEKGVYAPVHRNGRRLIPNRFTLWNLSEPASLVRATPHLSAEEAEDIAWNFFDEATSAYYDTLFRGYLAFHHFLTIYLA